METSRGMELKNARKYKSVTTFFVDTTSYLNNLKSFGDLFLLLDAKRSTKLLGSTGNVKTWEDLSDYKNHAVQNINNAQGVYNPLLNNNRGALVFNGSSTYYDSPFTGTISNRTILFYGGLNTLSNTGTFAGGGVVSVETSSLTLDSGSLFDSLVYAERTPLRWMNGSEYFNRTPLTDSTINETDLNNLRIAYAFGTNNFTMWKYTTQLSATTSYTPLSVTNGFFKIGGRHTGVANNSFITQNPWQATRTVTHSTNNGFFNGYIFAVCIYRNVLNASQVQAIFDILSSN